MLLARLHKMSWLFATLLALTCAPVLAQNAAGEEGSRVAQSLLQGYEVPTYSDQGGNGDAGSFDLAGRSVDTTEIAPGATTDAMQNVADSSASMSELEQSGIDKFDETARSETVQGEAARTLISAPSMSTEELLGDDPSQFSLVENQYLKNDPMGQAFADCKTTNTTTPGTPITTTKTVEASCTIGTQGAACGRQRILTIEPELDVQRDPRSDLNDEPVGPKVIDRITFNGQCESEAAESQCRVKWRCTDSEPRTVDGVLVDEDAAARLGLKPLFPGAPALCWAAEASVECPVCDEDEFGNKRNCTYVDVSRPEGDSCSDYAGNSSCKVVGQGCLVSGADGSCAVQSRRYSCDTPVTVDSTEVHSTNTCSGAIQCTDGSCNGGVDFNEKAGTSIQLAMAQMVVADALATDVTRDKDTIKQSKGPSTRDQAPAAADPNDPARQWGFDTDAKDSEEAPPERQLTAEQQAIMAEAQLFKGNPYSCQNGYGGLLNCCQSTSSNAEELYWQIHAEITKANQAARAAKSGTGPSGYEIMQQGGAGLSTLASPFTSLQANVLGGGSPGEMGYDPNLTVWQQFMARAREEIKPALSPKWACSDKEFDLAVQREIGACSYAGSYCSSKVLGACLKRKEAYCCFKSPMSKMLRESAEPNGIIDHGSPKRPDCSGIPIDEMDRIDWSKMDFSKLAGSMAEGGVFDRANDPANASKNYTGSGATNASTDRKNVEDRTMDRLATIDMDAVKGNIDQDARSRESLLQYEAMAAQATLNFAATYKLIPAGAPVAVSVVRSGSSGAASATVRVVQGSPDVVGFNTGEMRWGVGEIGSKNVRLNPPAGAAGRVVLEVVAHEGSAGDASLMTIEVK